MYVPPRSVGSEDQNKQAKVRDHRRSSVAPGSLFTDFANILPSVEESKMSLSHEGRPSCGPSRGGSEEKTTRTTQPQPLAYLAADGSLGEQPLENRRPLLSRPPSDLARPSSARKSGIVLIGPGSLLLCCRYCTRRCAVFPKPCMQGECNFENSY